MARQAFTSRGTAVTWSHRVRASVLIGAAAFALGNGQAAAQRSAPERATSAAPASPSANQPSAPTRLVLIAGQTLMPDGTLQGDRAVVIEQGVIVAIEDAAGFAGDPSALRYPDHVLSPGLVELGSALGVRGSQVGGTEPVEPGLSAADAIDPGDPALRAALERGITAAMVLPDPSRIVAGRAATFRTHPVAGAVGPRVQVLNDRGPAVISMGPRVFDFSYGPTSRAGAAFELREALAAARRGEGPMAELLPNPHGIIAVCSSIEDVDLVLLATAEAMGTGLSGGAGGGGGNDGASRLVVVHTPDDPSIVDELAEEEVPFVVGPLSFQSPSVSLLAVAGLSSAGASVAFANTSPLADPQWLRVAASLSVKHGMDPSAARRGMTSAAGEVTGVAIGAIRVGSAADLVLFSGDPLLLSSRVDAVYIDGRAVHRRRPSAREIGTSEPAPLGGPRAEGRVHGVGQGVARPAVMEGVAR